MSEPTIHIPARLALHIARHFHAQAELMRARGQGPAMNAFGTIKTELVDAIADQCSQEDIDAACVAAEMEARG